MDIAATALNNRTVVWVFTLVLLIGGGITYQGMSRLEDPQFTIKDALVVTPYSGATAAEVEDEVTDKLEIAIQQLGQLDEIKSRSSRGLSIITVSIKPAYDKSTLPQVWDELRRKVNDVAGQLPPGAGAPTVIDDYGDVFGVFLVITSDGYSAAELNDYADLLRRELLLVEDVGKISTYGDSAEAVYVEFDRDRMSQLGVPMTSIVSQLQEKTAVADGGRVKVGSEFIAIQPAGGFVTVEQFEALLIHGRANDQFHLRDVATVRRGYIEPQSPIIRHGGRPGIGIGISTVAGGNVVTMGVALGERLAELETQRPIGMEIEVVSLQSDAVSTAISGFLVSLVEAVAIVVLVLLAFMGLRCGLIIGFVLIVTILGSFIFLDPMNVALERVSLGALIVVLGMLVDNAIVIVDGILVRMQNKVSAEEAASAIVKQSAWPLLGATLVAVLAFAAIGTSEDVTGEYLRSLFLVVMVALLLSWVTAVTLTPVLCAMFLKSSAAGDSEKDLYAGKFYSRYQSFLRQCIRKRYLSIIVVLGLFVASLWGFTGLDQNFFPSSTRSQFMVDLWLPQGTHINDTQALVEEVEKYLNKKENISGVTSLIGEGGLRFLLTYRPEKPNSAYAQLLVDVDDEEKIPSLAREIETELAEAFPDALFYTNKFEIGPGAAGKIQARFSGPDANELRRLAEQAQSILREDPDSKAVRTDWRQRVKVIRPLMVEEQANLNGITHSMIAATIKQGFQGIVAGVFREGDTLLPIIVRAEEELRTDFSSAGDLQIWSPAASEMIPLRQVVSRFDTGFEDEIIIRRDRHRTITVYADPNRGYPNELLARVRPKIEALTLPEGYELTWGGEYESTNDAKAALAAPIPIFVLAMFLITIVLFNSIREPLIIWLCVPLAVVGVTAGLLLTGQPFGFMALLGFLSLMGMLIKNAIVLIDQIHAERVDGKEILPAIIHSGTSRLRPVAMAALTTALGMIPLLFDPFFSAMAITIIGGLLFATVLTMVVVPVLFAIFHNAPIEPEPQRSM